MKVVLRNGEFYTGDCLEVMRNLPNGSVDMILADLPYATTACSWDSIIPLGHLWEAYSRLIRKDGAIVLTASQPFTTQLAASNLPAFCYSLVWDKRFAGNFVQAKRMPLRTHEDILVFCLSGKLPRYFPQMIKRDVPIKKGGNKPSQAIPIRQTNAALDFGQMKKTYDEKHPISILEFSNRGVMDRGLHPTQKPVGLFEYLIRTYSAPGDLILDNTAGSGTTAIAAENSNRRWICIEQNASFANKAISRILNHSIVS